MLLILVSFLVEISCGMSPNATMPRSDDGYAFVVFRSKTSGSAAPTLLELSGGVAVVSPVAWEFEPPYVQCTVDVLRSRVLVTTFDLSFRPFLYILDWRLGLEDRLSSDGGFFDLQHNYHQDAVYGIGVVGGSGRALSNFTLQGSVELEHLVTITDGWFVNASSFDPATDRYFALLKMFATGGVYTDDQQLAVADFAIQGEPTITYFDLNPEVTMHFVGWCRTEQTLYGFGTDPTPARTNPTLYRIDLGTGEYTQVMPGLGASYRVGPLIVDDSGFVYAFVEVVSSGEWDMLQFDATRGKTIVVARYPSSTTVEAAAYAPWAA